MFIKKATKSISFNLCYGALPYTDIVSFYVLATLVDNKTKFRQITHYLAEHMIKKNNILFNEKFLSLWMQECK